MIDDRHYITLEAANLEALNSIINQQVNLGWVPVFITPVNMISPHEKDVNREQKRYFYYLITFSR